MDYIDTTSFETLSLLVSLIFTILIIAGMIGVFVKAKQPIWGLFIPIYNIILLLEIAQKPRWWLFIILFVPLLNILFFILTINGVSYSFGKNSTYTIGLLLLGFIFWPLLGFGNAKHQHKKQNNVGVIDDF
jgi:hypothetical protein